MVCTDGGVPRDSPQAVIGVAYVVVIAESMLTVIMNGFIMWGCC